MSEAGFPAFPDGEKLTVVSTQPAFFPRHFSFSPFARALPRSSGVTTLVLIVSSETKPRALSEIK